MAIGKKVRCRIVALQSGICNRISIQRALDLQGKVPFTTLLHRPSMWVFRILTMNPSLVRRVPQPRTIFAVRAIDTVHAIRTVGEVLAARAKLAVGAIIAVFAIVTIWTIVAVCTILVIAAFWLRIQEQTGGGATFIDVWKGGVSYSAKESTS